MQFHFLSMIQNVLSHLVPPGCSAIQITNTLSLKAMQPVVFKQAVLFFEKVQ